MKRNAVNPLLGPPGAYLFEAHLGMRGRLIETGAYLRVLHKELAYKVEKLKYKKVGGHAAEDQNQIRTSSW